ncbi:low affinity iron [Diplogelasinospora grovesii]|uniref:Low affinity iron n=1 Tax=Diplogelasinospora grovesii TaxID=303347 RepID=A0AAN6NA74_9PEZI|nr:low affinity iron [Diplogelasinospora grovesii]
MTNPFSFVTSRVKNYARSLRDAPAAQYMTRVAAPSVNPPSLTSPPPSAYNMPIMPHNAEKEYEESESEKRDRKLPSSSSQLPPYYYGFPPTTTTTPSKKTKKGGGPFDLIVDLAGSRWTFLGTLALLGVWAVVGIVHGPSDTWQVVLQDASSIQCYISATLLMRQQQNATRSLLGQICGMISRSESIERMLRLLTPRQLVKMKKRSNTRQARRDLASTVEQAEENLFDRVANWVSAALGSLLAILAYWTGILVWGLFGIPLGFSNTWQLYVNTATAIELTFTTMFLQSVRRQHEGFLQRCLRSIDVVNAELEMELRRMTGDLTPNPVVSSTPPKLSRVERAIDVYAFVVGGSVGVFISACVAVAWLSVGHVMGFDANWWLIIGTYTGLVGFVDGFVLRNVHSRETAMADVHFGRMLEADWRLYGLLDIPLADDGEAVGEGKVPLSAKISGAIGWGVSTPWASVGSVLSVVALLVAASAMRWTETGQLLCNTPTMIFEGFLLLMLIQAHNTADHGRRMKWADVLGRRLAIERRVAAAAAGAEEGEWELLAFDIIDEKKSGGGSGGDDGDMNMVGVLSLSLMEQKKYMRKEDSVVIQEKEGSFRDELVDPGV